MKWITRYRKAVDAVIMVTFFVLMLYGAYSLYDAWSAYHEAAGLQKELLAYRPDKDDTYHPTLEELMEINPDVCAWLTLDNTNVDGPVLQAEDNEKYVHTNVYGEFSAAGAIFLDCRNDREFKDPYSVLYGHHMDMHNMFGDLDLYSNKAFFNKNKTGWLMLPEETYRLTIFAFLSTDAFDQTIYYPVTKTEGDMGQVLKYVKEKAKYYRDIPVEDGEQIIAMTTCADVMTNGRYVVVAKMERYTYEKTEVSYKTTS